MNEKKKDKSIWLTLGIKAAKAAAIATAAAAVDIGLLQGSLGLFVKAALQSLQVA